MKSDIAGLVQSAGFRPALRADLEFFRSERDDVVVVHDPRHGRTFQLYEVECRIACVMDGQHDLEGITRLARQHVPWATSEHVVKLTVQIAGMGLLSNVDGTRSGLHIAPLSDDPILAVGTGRDLLTGVGDDEATGERDVFDEATVAQAPPDEWLVPIAPGEGVRAPHRARPAAEPDPDPDLQDAETAVVEDDAVARAWDDVWRGEPEEALVPAPHAPVAEIARPDADAVQPWSAEAPRWYQRTRTRRRVIALGALVLIGAVGAIPYPLYVTEECTLRPVERAEVRTQIDGILAKILVEEGDVVAAGAPIAMLDDRDVAYALQRAEADVAGLTAKVEKMRVGSRPEEIRRARVLASARADDLRFASREAGRQRTLYRQGVASATERDEAQRDFELKRSALSQAQAELRLVESGFRKEDVAAAEAELDRAKAELEYFKKQKDKLVIRSPIAGRVLTPRFSERLHEKIGAGDLVCEVGDSREIRVEIRVPERNADIVEAGQPVTVKVQSLPLEPFEGEVTFIAPAAEEKDGSTFVRVEAQLDNARGLLRPRMTGYAEIDAGHRPLLVRITRPLVRWIRVRFLL